MAICSECGKALAMDTSCENCRTDGPSVKQIVFKPTIFPPKYKQSFNWTWPHILSVVLFLLIGIHFYRVNAVTSTAAGDTSVFKSTNGTIVDGQIVVAAEDYLSFKMDFNRRVTVKGWFATGTSNKRIECLLLNKNAFELWKNGKEFNSVARTGFLPSGKMEHVVEPNTYFLIFSNQKPGEPEKAFETFFEIK